MNLPVKIEAFEMDVKEIALKMRGDLLLCLC